MDASVLQMFDTEEILNRLADKRCTGCFHVFNPRESANIFFEQGRVIAAAKGSVEGEEVLKQILEWRDVRYLWQPDVSAPVPPLKRLDLDIRDFLASQKSGAGAEKKTPSEAAILHGIPVLAPHPVISIPSRGATTGPVSPIITPDKRITQTSASLTPAAVGPVDLAATKTIDPSAQARSAQEHALLQKHTLVLVSFEHPEQRLKITRVNSLIGRNPACDIAINHSSISRQHCMLQITDRGLHVKDLETTNGTKVNGIVLKEGYISVGDKLTMGHISFMLERRSPLTPLPRCGPVSRHPELVEEYSRLIVQVTRRSKACHPNLKASYIPRLRSG